MLPDNDNLSDSVTDARGANVRENNPDLFGDTPAKSSLADLDTDTVAAISAEDSSDDDGGGTPADAGGDVPDRDEHGRFVPRARIDELTAQRNKERERADAAEAKAAEIESARQAEADAARAAAEAKAKEVHDFDADRDALQKRFDENEIDLAELNKEMRKLDRAEREQGERLAEERAVARIRKELQAERERSEQQTFEQIKVDAEAAAAEFMADPANAAYKSDVNRQAALNAQREIIFNERNGNIGWVELLNEAKKRVEASFNPTKTETDGERVARARREAQARATAEVSALPARPAGGTGTRATAEPEDENDLTPEQFRALPKAERDKRLGRTA